MVTIQEIEKAVSNLPPGELEKFRAWFEEFDAQLWDKQLDGGIKSGRLDSIASVALADFKAEKVQQKI